MGATIGGAARRELAVVLGVAFGGVALVLLVAFAPWYGRAAAAVPNSPVVRPDPSVSAQVRDVTPAADGR